MTVEKGENSLWGMGVPGAHVPDRWGKPQKGFCPASYFPASGTLWANELLQKMPDHSIRWEPK